MIFAGIVVTLLFLLLVPFAYGCLLMAHYKKVRKTDVISVYVYGVCLFYALFTCFTIPCTILRLPFHVVKGGGLMLGVVSIPILIFAMWSRNGEQVVIRTLKQLRGMVHSYWWIIFPLSIIAFQIFRSVLRMNSVYSDDDTYMPVILDMLKTDKILETNAITGELHNYYTYNNPKLLLSAWLQFLAFLSSVSGLHPLILVKTVLPSVFICWHYLIIWKLTFYLSRDYGRRIGMLFFYALLMEFGSPSLNTDFSYYLFTWNWYGKSVLQFFAIPIVILFFLMIREIHTGWREGLILMILVTAGLGFSMMGMILLTILVLVFVLIECVEKHSVREMWLLVPPFVPLVVYALIYFTMF